MAGLRRDVDASILPIATYVMVTEPLGPRLDEVLSTRAAVYDTRFAFDYYRPLPDSRLLWGGRISVLDRSPEAVKRLLYRDLLYVTQSREAILTCLNPKTGEVLSERQRLPELKVLYASPVAANGRIYYTDRQGTTLVLKHGVNPEVLATNHLEDGTDASPAIVGNQMFIRTAKHLHCLQEQ